MPKAHIYTPKNQDYSALANEAAHDAFRKLTDDERAELYDIIDTIRRAQLRTIEDSQRQVNTIATGGIELMGKLGMFLNGVRYAEFIRRYKKG